jgi:hypothetical protein
MEKPGLFGNSIFEIGYCLGFGAWDLEFITRPIFIKKTVLA